MCGSAKGIRYATLPEPSPERALHDLEGMLRGALPEHVPGAFDAYRDQLNEYLSGERTAWDVTLDLEDVAPFFRRAWDACRSIPAGETRNLRMACGISGQHQGGARCRAGHGAESHPHRHTVPPRHREGREGCMASAGPACR